MADQTQRLEIATVRAEVGSNIVFRFANDAANADSIPTQSGNIKNLKQVVLEIQQDAAEKISISTTIYPTVSAGLAATADQGIFLVQSNDADEIYTVWQNQGGTAVNTGKTALSATAIQTALDASNEAAQAAEQAADVATSRTVRYLLPSAAQPTVRDNGLPLEVGDIWFNTIEQTEYRYTNTGWKANDSQQAIADLENKTDVTKGASNVGWDGDRVSDQLSLARKITNYEQLRSYNGPALRVVVMQADIFGVFQLDINDVVTPDNGGTIIVGAGNRRWKRQYNGNADARWFGSRQNNDATNPLQNTIYAAESKNQDTLIVEDSLNIPNTLTDRSRVFMRGSGKLSGDGAYRKQVFPWNAQSGRQIFNDLDPIRHLQRFSSTKTPNVVLVGSSTGAWSPNSIDTGSTVARILADRIAQFNPDKSVKFYNRCIGAQSYDQLDGIPTIFPDWYTDRSKPWLDYVKNLSPDVVFIIMGSGDSGAMSYPRLKSVTDKINAFPKGTDIVYITQPSVNPDPHPNYAAFGTKQALEGRDYAAGLIRSFAQFNKYGYIDANRTGGIVLDGRDLMDTVSERMISAFTIINGEFSSPYNGHDFAFRVEFPGNAAAIDSYFLNAANPVFFRVGAGTSDLRGGDIVYIRKNSSGKFRFELFAKNSGNYSVVEPDVMFPTGPFSLDIYKTGNTVGVSIANSEDTTFMTFPIIAHGGEFPAQFGCRNGGGPFSVLAYLNIGTPKQYLPALTSQQAWGEKSADATTQLPYGGNGVNHFSSLGTTFIYGPLLNRDVLTAARQADGTYTPLLGEMTNVSGTPTPSVAMWSRVGDSITVSGAINITPAAAGTTQVDLTLPIPTTLEVPANLAGVCGVGGALGMMGSVWGNNAVHRARIQITTQVTTAQNVRYSYTYRLK